MTPIPPVHGTEAMADSSKDKDNPTTCTKCGGPVEKRRRPLSLRDLLAIAALLVFGGVPVVAFRQSDAIWFAGFFYGLGVFSLLGGVVLAPRYRKRLRCIECWAPSHRSSRPQVEIDFWVVYVIVVGLFLSTHLCMYVFP